MATRSAGATRVRTQLTTEGECKQEAKTFAAIDAIRRLERKPIYKHEMMCLLQRLVKKANYQEEQKAKIYPTKVSSISEILE
jgi:hypothetical protein